MARAHRLLRERARLRQTCRPRRCSGADGSIERYSSASALDPRDQALLDRIGSETRRNLGPWSRYLGTLAILGPTAFGLAQALPALAPRRATPRSRRA